MPPILTKSLHKFQELKDLIAKSQAQSEVAIKNLTQQIEQKLTNV